ncbi:MAG: hypothetical protein WA001_04635 [Patescibacteria group bacterium]
MNKFSALSTIVSISIRAAVVLAVAALTGCASTMVEPKQVEREYVINASQSPIAQFVDQQAPARHPTDMWTINHGAPRIPSTDHATIATHSPHNSGNCAWLVSTGQRFDSKSQALAFAKEQKFTDQRVGEVCFDRTASELGRATIATANDASTEWPTLGR